jgi:phosphomannomutase
MKVTANELTANKDVKFGTSGLRGLVADLTDEVAYAYTRAFLTSVAADASGLVIGHDLRDSSPRIAAACLKAAQDGGLPVFYVGALPTPAIAYFGLQQGCPSIVVTGSHIPFDRNGIKFYTAVGEITKAHESLINSAHVALPDIVTTTLPPVDVSAYQHYCDRYLDVFGTTALAGLTVALYQHSSVGRDLFADLFERMGAEVISLGRTDQFVPIDTEAVSPEDHKRAEQWAAEYKFDCIFSTDGDADRPLVGNERGRWLRGDRLGVLCAQSLYADAVVTPVSSNSVAEECASFARVERTRIGSPFVIEAMEALSSSYQKVVGYEANGGFLVGSELPVEGEILRPLATRDAILPFLVVMAVCQKRGISLSELEASLPEIYTASDRVKGVTPERGAEFIAQLNIDPYSLEQDLELQPFMSADATDGCRLRYEGNVIVHFRQSGNAPELRCYTEARSEHQAREINARALAWAVSHL